MQAGGCSNQMQVAQGHTQGAVCALVQATIDSCILLVLVPKDVKVVGKAQSFL